MDISLQFALFGLLSYAAVHLIHVGVWRHRSSLIGTRLLFTILLFIPLAGYVNIVMVDGVDWVIPMVVHAVLAANYIAIYPAFQASSPTLKILHFLWTTREPVSETELEALFPAADLLGPRVEDLKRSGLIVETSAHTAVLSKKGDLVASCFIAYRNLLGLPMGAG